MSFNISNCWNFLNTRQGSQFIYQNYLARQQESDNEKLLNFLKTPEGKRCLQNYIISRRKRNEENNNDEEEDLKIKDDEEKDLKIKDDEEEKKSNNIKLAEITVKSTNIITEKIAKTSVNILCQSKSNKGIRNIQNSLIVLGYDIGPYGADGIYGNKTKEALINFQKDSGLEQNGKIDLLTIHQLKNKIFDIQKKLKDKGYSLGKCGADGICGNCTINAIKNFQKNINVENNGIIGLDNNNIQRKKLFAEESKVKENLMKIIITKFETLLLDLKRKILKEDEKKFLDICNDIIKKVFDFVKIDIKVTLFEKEYTQKIGPIKINIKAKSGGNFTYGNDKYIFKYSKLVETKGLFLNTIDFISEYLKDIFPMQIKKNIEIFKRKVGQVIINGGVTIKIEFNKITYEFEAAAKDDFTKLYGTLTISFELDINIDDIIKKLSSKIMDSLSLLSCIILSLATVELAIGGIIGILFIGMPCDQVIQFISN